MGDWFSDNGFTSANGYSVSKSANGSGTATYTGNSGSSSSSSSKSTTSTPSTSSSSGSSSHSSGGGGGSVATSSSSGRSQMNTNGLSGYALAYANAWNSGAKDVTSTANQSYYGQSTPNAQQTQQVMNDYFGNNSGNYSTGSSGGGSTNNPTASKPSSAYPNQMDWNTANLIKSGQWTGKTADDLSKFANPQGGSTASGTSYGYNPYNGQYFGDGTGILKDSQGNRIANNKTGALFYGDTGFRTTANPNNQAESMWNNMQDFNQKAVSSGSKTAQAYAQEQMKRFLAGDPMMYTYKGDFRGFADNGNVDTQGREFAVDPFSGQMTGNIAMSDPNYDLLKDPRFNYGNQDYVKNAFLQQTKQLEKDGKIVPGENATSLADVWTQRFMDSKYKPDNPYEQMGITPLASNIPGVTGSPTAPQEQNLATGAPVSQKEVEAKLAGNDTFNWDQFKDKDRASQEIVRAQQKWGEYQKNMENATSPEDKAYWQQKMDDAHTYANRVRGIAGINADGITSSGLEGTKYDPSYIAQASPQEVQQVAQSIVQAPPQQQNQIMTQIQQAYVDLQKQAQTVATQQAQAEVKQKTQAIQNLLASIQNQMKQSMDLLNNSVADSKKTLDESSFQDWMKARQTMASRGLAGSGIASDQDTRLLMNKQNQLGSIMKDAQTRLAGINSDYQGQIGQLNQQLSQIDPNSLYNDYYQKYLQSNGSLLNDQMKNMIDMYKWNNPSADNILDNQTDMYKWNNPSANQQMQTQFDYTKLKQDGQVDQAKLQLQLAQLGLDTSKVMGYDSQGNPTLDARKLAEEIRHNGVGEQINQVQNAISQGRLDETIRSNDMKAEQFKATFANTQLGGQASALKSLISSSGSQLKQLIDLKKSGNGGANINSQIANATAVYQSNVKALEVLEGLSQKSATPTEAGLTYGNGSPSSTFSNFSNSGGGGDYNNYYKLKNDAQASNSNYATASQAIAKAIQDKGVDSSWLPAMLEIAGRESDWNPNAQNPGSTAYGLFQFLNSTWSDGKTSDPYSQARQAVDYIKGRYGTPQNALKFWDEHKWY